MKCPICNGSGKCYEQKIRYQEIETNRTDFTLAKCHKCNGTGEVQMTNEEYLKSCNTEQLAEELLAWWFDGANTYSEFGLYNREIEEAKERIVKWLKEKHE